jgi:hypothetical protein
MYQVMRVLVVAGFALMMYIGCSYQQTQETSNHSWQKIAEVKANDLQYLKNCNGNRFSFLVHAGSQVAFENDLISEKTIVEIGAGLQLVTVKYDSSVTDPHLDIIDKNGWIYESWCLKGTCLPKAPRMPIGGVVVRLAKDRIQLATE